MKLTTHTPSTQVYSKEVFIPRPSNATPPTKPNTTPVTLYFDPNGAVSVVDVLVMEGMRIDYAQPLTSLEDGNSSEFSDKSQAVTKKTRKDVLDLPTVTNSHFYGNSSYTEDPLPDVEDSLMRLSPSAYDSQSSPKRLPSAGLKSSAGDNDSQPRYWEQLQIFCDTLVPED